MGSIIQVFLGKRECLPVRLIARRVSPEQAERRRKNANREKVVKSKGVQQPNERKRRAAGDKLKRPRKHMKTGRARLQLLDHPDQQPTSSVAHGGRGSGASTLLRAY
jgi:hypothetical protein